MSRVFYYLPNYYITKSKHTKHLFYSKANSECALILKWQKGLKSAAFGNRWRHLNYWWSNMEYLSGFTPLLRNAVSGKFAGDSERSPNINQSRAARYTAAASHLVLNSGKPPNISFVGYVKIWKLLSPKRILFSQLAFSHHYSFRTIRAIIILA